MKSAPCTATGCCGACAGASGSPAKTKSMSLKYEPASEPLHISEVKEIEEALLVLPLVVSQRVPEHQVSLQRFVVEAHRLLYHSA